MSSKEWWYKVIENTYLTTRDLTELEPDEIKSLMPKLFEMLYTNVFGTKEGWIVKEDVEYTLTKLKEWRDLGSGPKIGVISNFDDRLHKIMSGSFCIMQLIFFQIIMYQFIYMIY